MPFRLNKTVAGSVKCFLLLSALVGFIFISCKKERSCENCQAKNKPPVANAGPDQIITLPRDSTILDGRQSTDPDGVITNFKWTKISGPSSFNITHANDSFTLVKNLAKGSYIFELRVTDNAGFISKDSMRLTVDSILTVNHPPVANAGPDQTITLPVNTVQINGSGSSDPDNNIASYAWTKISGPASITIATPTIIQSSVSDLVSGIYQVELKVTDAGGLFSKDTMQIIVVAAPPPVSVCSTNNRPLVTVQLTPVGSVSVPRIDIRATAAGTKIIFAGGQYDDGAQYMPSSRVDIFDTVTQSWSTAELSAGKWDVTAVNAGNKIYFAGGHTNFQQDWDNFHIIDIYDAVTNGWSTLQLPERRMDLAAVRLNDKIYYAGGKGGWPGIPTYISNRVDILNLSNNQWSNAILYSTRSYISGAAAGNQVFFAGGNLSSGAWTLSCFSANHLDIFDNTGSSWGTINDALSRMTSITLGNKIFWAGGHNMLCSGAGILSSRVEIRDVSTNSIIYDCLFEARVGFDAGYANNKIIFFTGESDHPTKFDIYDPASNSWSIGVLPPGFDGPYATMVCVNNSIYVSGLFVNGTLSNQVWKLSF
jgi:hypothetical protein